MPLAPPPYDLILRIALVCLAGAAVGFNREGRNQAAGLRTTILVCLAACVAMILANMMLITTGKGQGFFAQMDPLRLPLGSLSGMGFLGAGASIKRGDSVLGVTTAATLWFMTVVGLCFGAGRWELGTAATVLALTVIWGLQWVDERIERKQRGSLVLCADSARFSEGQLHQAVAASALAVIGWEIIYSDEGEAFEAHLELEWKGKTEDRTRSPPLLEKLIATPGVRRVEWRPEALSA